MIDIEGTAMTMAPPSPVAAARVVAVIRCPLVASC
jgi:hypothetical protein